MNYQKIHDCIINRARQRILFDEQYTEKHHIIPKCEGGKENDETVLLTHKEHKLIHKLRYKITNVIGNLLAYNFMTNSVSSRRKNILLSAKLGGIEHHRKYKIKNPEEYSKRQSVSGKNGGNVCFEKKLGFFQMSNDEKRQSQDKGRKTIVENKIGMFSDEYRQQHRLSLFKKIKTPDGIFNSISSAAEYYNIVPGAVTYRLKNWNDWTYLTDGEK